MKLTEVPIYNSNGELQFTAALSGEELQVLLQFAINFQLAMANRMGVAVMSPPNEDRPQELDD